MDEIPAGPGAFLPLLFCSFPFFGRGWLGALFKTELIFGGHYACTPDQHVSLASLHGMMERPNLPLSPACIKADVAQTHTLPLTSTEMHTLSGVDVGGWSQVKVCAIIHLHTHTHTHKNVCVCVCAHTFSCLFSKCA